MKALIIPLLFVGATLFPTARSLAQMESPPSFSVESNEVLVPTSVYDMTLMDLPAILIVTHLATKFVTLLQRISISSRTARSK